MTRLVAFLRGMNLGRRRITNDELAGHFEAAGFHGVAPYQASGNVVFDDPGDPPPEVETAIEDHLETALGYSVDTFVRSLRELAELVAREEAEPPDDGFKVHALFLKRPAGDDEAAALAALEGEDDIFRPLGREVLWLRRGGLSDADIDTRDLEAALGPKQTMRTLGTVRRIVKKFGAERAP